jgi:hypothetical protein
MSRKSELSLARSSRDSAAGRESRDLIASLRSFQASSWASSAILLESLGYAAEPDLNA